MTVILVLLTFALFVGLDLVLQWRKGPETEREHQGAARPGLTLPPALAPVWVSGYQLPAELHYHPGHTWARMTAPDTVLVGMDDFARRLVHDADGVTLPEPGRRVRQGEPSAVIASGERRAELVAPVDGQVVAVNRQLSDQPQLATDDPYRRGWLYAVRPASLNRNLRNLLTGGLARRWIEDARERLELQLMALSGSVVQDGGEPVSDWARHVSDEDWRRLAADFLRT
jgi:glycine cleavage system H lipoate-binding protein